MPQKEIPRKPFVFLSIDVIDHTERLRNAFDQSNYDFRELDDVLDRLPDAIERAIPNYKRSMRWDWAGDGGIYAFPAENEIATFPNVIDAAERIITALDEFNAEHDLEPIRVRIAIDHGTALVKRQKAFCRSLALNVAAKLKVPDDCNSISITGQIYQEIRKVESLAGKFVPLPWTTDEARRHTDAPIVYGHAGLIRQALISKRDRHIAAEQHLFAAHCEYRRFCVDLAASMFEDARDAITAARSLAEQETSRRGYFRNAIRAFYAAWEQVADEWSLLATIGDRLVFLLAHEQRLTGILGAEGYRRLRDVEFAMEQLDLLATLFLNGPASVVTLEMNALLLRAGYSPLYANRAVARKTTSDYRELENAQWRLHGDCSLCTSAAVSALGLSGLKASAFVRSIEWLGSLRYCAFAHHAKNYAGVKADEHAKHYAAHVLQAFLAAGANDELVQSVLNTFFPPNTTTPQDVLKYWMKWRSAGMFDVGAQIFAALLDLERSPHCVLLDPYRLLLRGICDHYAAMIQVDAVAADVSPYPVLKSVQKNVAALTLGLLLGSQQCSDTLDDVLKVFDHMVVRAVATHYAEAQAANGVRRRYFLSSRIDRVMAVVAGWLAAFDATTE